jgi:hypothetical protein
MGMWVDGSQYFCIYFKVIFRGLVHAMHHNDPLHQVYLHVREILKSNQQWLAGSVICPYAKHIPIYQPLMQPSMVQVCLPPCYFQRQIHNSPETAVAPLYFPPALATGLAPLHCMISQASLLFDDLVV